MKELLFSITKKDFKINYFSGTGAGGQHRNRHMNSVRLTHLPSNVTVTGQSNKERLSNIKEALNNILKHPKFKIWHNEKVMEMLTGKSIDDRVNESMSPENLIIESKDENGRWSKDNDLWEHGESNYK